MKALLSFCLAAVLLIAGVASAQSEPPAISSPVSSATSTTPVPAADTSPSQVVERAPARANQGLRTPIAIWAASVAADQTTTYLFSSRYSGVLHERNFLIRGLDQHPAALVAAGTAIDAATGWLAYRLLRGHPRIATAVFLAAAGYRSYLAIYNMRMMRRAQAITTVPGIAAR
ncbi:MAG: hypothetical protein ACM3NQ_02610 [Bacteroidales bacterium]